MIRALCIIVLILGALVGFSMWLGQTEATVGLVVALAGAVTKLAEKIT